MKGEKNAITWVRESRRRISERFGHDPKKLVEYYIEQQQQYQDRMAPGQSQKPQKQPAS